MTHNYPSILTIRDTQKIGFFCFKEITINEIKKEMYLSWASKRRLSMGYSFKSWQREYRCFYRLFM